VGSWIVSADLLARGRFAISPLAETVAALTVLSRPDPPPAPWERAFRAQHREAYLVMLNEDGARRAIADCLWRPRRGDAPGWMADFLALPPGGPGASFEEEIGQLAAWDDDRIRAEIRSRHGRSVPESGLREAVAGIMRWIWTTALAATWPRRRRVLEADIVSRTSRLASGGWAAALAGLGPRVRWLGSGRLAVNGYDVADEDISRARELSFVPVHGNGSWTVVSPPDRFALVYPVAGALADIAPARPDGLARLIGANRARVLRLLDVPHSTTRLAALTGLPAGAVGGHLRVLLDSGAVLRRRAGREVLYWRTPLGDSLAAAGDPGPAR
jgi:DNA-binding transcriptional ArsR family regulator